VKEETQNKIILIFMVFVSEARAGENWKNSKNTILTVPQKTPSFLVYDQRH
jgi:hypothetical protein